MRLLGVLQANGADAALAPMGAAMHRPPRQPAAWTGEGAAFLACGRHEGRLHVTDELVVLLAGWLEVRDDRDAEPVDPKAHDGARLAKAWERWGVDLVRYVDGEFAAAVYERRSGVLHLLRDAVGSRPLFWARAPGCFAFASEIEPLLTLPWVRRELAREHLAEYLAFRAVHAPRTLLRDVQQLPGGHRLRAAQDGVRVVRTAQPPYAAPGTAVPRVQDVVPEIQAAIERAVKRRLATPERVGLYLSGGVGSSVIVAAIRQAARSIPTFTVAFADEASPETPFAGRVAQLLGMDHHLVTVGTKEVAERFDDAVAAVGQPIGNVASVLQLELAKVAGEHVDVVLTGDGTDQLFGGAMLEGPAAEIRRLAALHRIPSPARRVLRRLLEPLGRGASLQVSPDAWPLRQGIGGVHVFDAQQRSELLLDESLSRPAVRTEVLSAFYDEVDSDVLNRVLHAFFQSTLVADTLPRVEGTAASAGVEPGFPLLDREVRRVAKVLPGGFKVHGLGGRTDLPTRWLLRTTLQGALPAALVNRPDRGLPRPLDTWLVGSGRLFMEERFARLREDPFDLFHTNALEALKRGLGKNPGATQRMWALFILDAWLRRVRVA